MRTLVSALVLLATSMFAQQVADTAAAEQNQPLTVTIPAGTKLPIVLRQAINTKTARPGDPVYCATNFPVVQDDRILIPVGTYVQGSITSLKRPGRVHGRAEILMHFDRLIFANGYTVSLPGAVDNVPGADHEKVKDKEGTVQADSSKGRDVGTVATTAGTGAGIGAISAGAKGAGIGAAAGGVGGLAITMLTRGNDVKLEQGTSVEMVLQRPLQLEEERLSANPNRFMPSARQQRPMERPRLTPSPDTR